jgi:hypothetical protein
MHKFTVCSVILSDSSFCVILVAPQTEIHAQRTTLPSHKSEKHCFIRAYFMLDMCEFKHFKHTINQHHPIRFRVY